MSRQPGEGKCEATCLDACDSCPHMSDNCGGGATIKHECERCICYGCDKEEER